MSGREPAWRVFAIELLASLFDEKGSGDRAASYLLSPLGARMNRVLVFGTLEAPEAIGNDESRPFLRSRLTDPTGTMSLTAGSFQPRALAGLRALSSAGACMVVGKAHLFVGRTGTAHPSVRAEALRPVSPEELRAGWAEAADQTLTRIEIVEALRSGRAPPGGGRIPSVWELGARAAISRYPSSAPGAFRAGLEAVARALASPEAARTAPPPVRPAPPPAPATPAEIAPRVRVTRTPATTSATHEASAVVRAQESAFLDIVDELSERSTDGYADLRETTGLASRRGIAPEEADQMLNRLEEQGVLEEPVVGKIRRA